jgi:hypothetical protein
LTERVNQVVSGIEVMKKGALSLKRSSRRRTVDKFEALVSSDVDVQLVIYVQVRPSYKDDAEAGSVVGIVECKHPRRLVRDFFVNDAVGKSERPSEGVSFQANGSF